MPVQVNVRSPQIWSGSCRSLLHFLNLTHIKGTKQRAVPDPAHAGQRAQRRSGGDSAGRGSAETRGKAAAVRLWSRKGKLPCAFLRAVRLKVIVYVDLFPNVAVIEWLKHC